MEETQREEDVMLVSLRKQRRCLKEGLQRSQHLTLSMLSTLSSFHQRLSASLSPAPQVETVVADDPATDFDRYTRRLDSLLEAINFFKSNRWLKDSDETLCQAENLLVKSMAKLEDLFRHTLTENREIRSSILEHMLRKLGFENLRTDETQKALPDCSDVKVTEWPKHLLVSIQLLFAGERKACDQVFNQLDPHRNQCFVNVVENIMSALLNFAETAIKSKRHCESLFPILDMFNTMHIVLPEVNTMFQTNEGARLRQRYEDTFHKLGQTTLETFYKFEQIIYKDSVFKASRQDGMVHALTSHVTSFVKRLSNYESILRNLFSAQEEGADSSIILTNSIAKILTTLLSKLEKKARVYKDSALAHIFLMNNVQYIIRIVQRCNVQSLVGEEWLQKHQSIVQLHATGYLHAAWDKVLQCLSTQGLAGESHEMVGTGVARSVLKERFEMFNQNVEERCHRQVQWTVVDPQLKKALRRAVMDSVVPSYGLFLKRFGAYFESSKNPKKYIKYTVQDLEHLLADLFEGKVVL